MFSAAAVGGRPSGRMFEIQFRSAICAAGAWIVREVYAEAVGRAEPGEFVEQHERVACAERRRLFKRGTDFKLEGVTPVLRFLTSVLNQNVHTGRVWGMHAYLRLWMGRSLFVSMSHSECEWFYPYVDYEQAWAIFAKKEPNPESCNK